MVLGVLFLVLLQWLSSLIVNYLGLPIPAPVLGIMVLLLMLSVRGYIPSSLLAGSNFLLPLIPLFLVPASVGVIDQIEPLRQDAIPIILALFISLTFSMALVPFIFIRFMRWFGNS